MAKYTKTTKKSSSTTNSESRSQSQSTTKNVLDEALLETILGGLGGQMSAEEIEEYAKALLGPQLRAGIEAAQQEYETAKLTREQEIENLAAQLGASIEAQNRAYRQNMADVETAALARGMGRSSYTLSTLAKQGDALAKAVRELTDENERKSAQIRRQITQAAGQSEETKSRLNADYAANLAAKIQELTQAQRKEQNSNYLTAVSASMGKQTTGESTTKGASQTSSSSTTTTVSGKTGGSSGSSKKKKEEDIVDAVSSAAPSVKRLTGR